MLIKEFVERVTSKEINILENTQKVLEETKKINKEYNYFTTISENLALQQAKELQKNPKGKLAGVPISIKDCICVKDVQSSAGSKILKGYKPIFQATVIQNIIKEGAIIIGKTTQDEFGFGSFSTNTEIIPKNPFDKKRSCGGSSGGAAGFTKKANFTHIALAESTGGSIVNPASFCGVIGFCPTYGLISRYGLIDYANSLDKIGLISKNTKDIEYTFPICSTYDKKDSTSLDKKINPEKKIKKIALIKESLNIDKQIKEKILKKLDTLDIEYKEVSLPLTQKYSIPVYYLIALAEASTNLARYCGMRYGYETKIQGNYNEYFSQIRSQAFSKESKRRIILGTFTRMAGYRDAYYMKAMKIRTLIINEYKSLFKKYDLIASPTMPIIAPKFSEIEKLTPIQNYQMDSLTVGPNLAGLPHISFNAGEIDKLPVGIMFTADHFNENKLFNIAK